METLLAISGRDFVLMASDAQVVHSILVVKSDQSRFHKLGDKLLMSVVGEGGDPAQFAEYISKNIALYRLRNGYDANPAAAANFTRNEIATALRSRDAYQINALIGGVDEKTGLASLYYVDFLGMLVKVPYCGHGYGGQQFTTSILDDLYDPSLSSDEALELLNKCINQIAKRSLINQPRFKVRLVNKDGVHELPDLTVRSTVRPIPADSTSIGVPPV